MDMFSALLGKSLSDGGGSEPVLVSKSITANGTYDPADDNADGYSSVSVDVPNTYTAADEGKVVSNGSLVAQTSSSVTQNGTVDTTLINSLTVNVSGGTGTAVKLIPYWDKITNSDVYIVESDDYIYIFGTYSNTAASAPGDIILFSIPESFDLSKIGSTSSNMGMRYRYSSPTATTVNCTIDKTDRLISASNSYLGNTAILSAFVKSA